MGMGQSASSKLPEKLISDMLIRIDAIFKANDRLPDIGIDGSLNVYSGLNSTDVLQDYSSQVLSNLESKGPDYVNNLGSALASLTNVPNAVGICALVISIALDLVVSSSGREDSPMNMIRRVFVEKEAFGVKDTMDEYIKRLRMHMRDPARALEETQRLEKQLRSALTTLRNSMLRKEIINIHEMKQWTNGAAFHVQMVIHEARLKMAGYGSRKDGYESELSDDVASISTRVHYYEKTLKELFKRVYILSDKNLSEDFFNSLFMRLERTKELIEYFANLQKNLKTLIMQHESFRMPGLA